MKLNQFIYYLLLEAEIISLIVIAYIFISHQYGAYFTTPAHSHLFSLLAINLFGIFMLIRYRLRGFALTCTNVLLHEALFYIFFILRYGNNNYLLFFAIFILFAIISNYFSMQIISFHKLLIIYLCYYLIWYMLGFPITYFEAHYWDDSFLAHALEILGWIFPLSLQTVIVVREDSKKPQVSYREDYRKP